MTHEQYGTIQAPSYQPSWLAVIKDQLHLNAAVAHCMYASSLCSLMV